jgi:hypothetical protein
MNSLDFRPIRPSTRSRASAARSEACRSFGSLGQDLERVLRTLGHHVENLSDERFWDIGVKQVRHGVDEDGPRPSPTAREIDRLRPECQRKPLRICRRKAACHPLGVTPVAAGRHFSAAQPLDSTSIRSTRFQSGRPCRTGYQQLGPDLVSRTQPEPLSPQAVQTTPPLRKHCARGI